MRERWISGEEGENVTEYVGDFIIGDGAQVQGEEKFWV